jgi:hypothetical protein
MHAILSGSPALDRCTRSSATCSTGCAATQRSGGSWSKSAREKWRGACTLHTRVPGSARSLALARSSAPEADGTGDYVFRVHP